MSDFYEEQISDLEDHVGGLEIDLKEANQEIKKLRDALEKILTVDRSKGGIMQIIAKQALEATK